MKAGLKTSKMCKIIFELHVSFCLFGQNLFNLSAPPSNPAEWRCHFGSLFHSLPTEIRKGLDRDVLDSFQPHTPTMVMTSLMQIAGRKRATLPVTFFFLDFQASILNNQGTNCVTTAMLFVVAVVVFNLIPVNQAHQVSSVVKSSQVKSSQEILYSFK